MWAVYKPEVEIEFREVQSPVSYSLHPLLNDYFYYILYRVGPKFAQSSKPNNSEKPEADFKF